MSILPDYLRYSLLASDGGGGGGGGGKTTTPIDFENPLDNLYAFGKLWATYADQPVFSAFHGLMFAKIGTQRLQPLFGYTGFGGFQARQLTNGHVQLRGKETGFFTDLASGQILEDWQNPYTDERVEVFNFLNDRVRGELGPSMPEFHFGAAEDSPTLMNDGTARRAVDGKVPFILPWEQYGESVLLSWDYTHSYRNPVTAQKWPRASTGDYINPSEHFTFNTTLTELNNRDLSSARYHCGFSRLSPWWPWMRMGKSNTEGGLFGRMHSHKSNRGFDDIPKVVLDYTERHHPDYLEPCTDWDDGAPLGTWEAYARDVPPEVF